MLADFLGLSSSGWTAIGTVSLALVTVLYVIETRKIAGRSADSADAARRGAEAAERTARTAEAAAAEDRERRRLDAEESRVRLMRGLLAEVEENIEMAQHTARFRLPFVRDVWAVAKDRIGDLPDEAVDTLRKAYALASRTNELLRLTDALTDRGADAGAEVAQEARSSGQEAEDSFRDAATVLRYWLRMKEARRRERARRTVDVRTGLPRAPVLVRRPAGSSRRATPPP
jgi:hypothetical protein